MGSYFELLLVSLVLMVGNTSMKVLMEVIGMRGLMMEAWWLVGACLGRIEISFLFLIIFFKLFSSLSESFFFIVASSGAEFFLTSKENVPLDCNDVGN